MGTYKIEELRQAVGHVETVAVPSHAKKSTRTKEAVGQVPRYKTQQDHRPRAETEQLIKTAISEAGKPLTFHMIAAALNRSTSPHLRSIVLAMAEREELLVSSDVSNNPKIVRYWYSLPS